MQSTPLDCPYSGAPLASGVTQCPNCLNEIEAAPAPIEQSQQQAPVVNEPEPDYQQPPPASTPSDWRYVSLMAKIIAVLILAVAAINIGPRVVHNVGQKNQQVQSSDKLKALGVATHKYADAHNGELPPTTTIQEFRDALAPYMADSKTAEPYMEPGANAYYWINPSVSKKKLTSIKNPTDTELAEETVPQEGDYFGILFVDGNVHYYTKAQRAQQP